MIDLEIPRFARLNTFQEVMALWEEEHPYNAGRVLRLRGRADVASLGHAISMACQEAGLGKLVLDRKRGRYRYEPAGSIELREIRGGNSVPERLWATLDEEMHKPFPDGPHHPIRWWVLDDPNTGSHFFVVIYRHIIADFTGMSLLLRRVLRIYYRSVQPVDEGPLQLYPPDYARVMRHHFRALGYLATLARAARLYLRMRSVYRLPERRDAGREWRFCVLEAPSGLVGRLAGACKTRKVTVNEVFLATLCAAVATMTPHRRRHRRRRGLALAHVVNVRGEASEDLSRCFGVYLGESVTIVDEPDVEDFEKLLDQVVAEIRPQKAGKRFAGPQWNFLILARLRGWLPVGKTRPWYRKVYPLAAGVSNIKQSASWFTGVAGHIVDFTSIASPGPALPIVLFAATMDERVNFTLVYRESSLAPPEARELVELFVRRLEGFSNCYPSNGRASA